MDVHQEPSSESAGVRAFTQEGGFHVVLTTGTTIGGGEQSGWFSLAAQAFLLFQQHIPALGSTRDRNRRPSGRGRDGVWTKAPHGQDLSREMFPTPERKAANAGDEWKEGATSLCGFSSNKQADNPAFVWFAGCTRQTSALTLDPQRPPSQLF